MHNKDLAGGFTPPSFVAAVRHGLVANNLSGKTLLTSFSLRDVPGVFAVPNEEHVQSLDGAMGVQVAQRDLDAAKSEEIALYLVKAAAAKAYGQHESNGLKEIVEVFFGAEDRVPHYFALPVVEAAAFKKDVEQWKSRPILETAKDRIYEFDMPDGQRLWLVDGQHRWKGICLAIEFFDKEVASGTLSVDGILRRHGGLARHPSYCQRGFRSRDQGRP